MIGTLQPSCAVARPELTVPTWRSAGLQAGDIGLVTTVVAGTVAGLSSQGTAVGVAEPVVEVADAPDAPDNWHPERTHANTSRTGKLLMVFSTRAGVYSILPNPSTPRSRTSRPRCKGPTIVGHPSAISHRISMTAAFFQPASYACRRHKQSAQYLCAERADPPCTVRLNATVRTESLVNAHI